MSGFKNAERLTVYTHLRTFESDFDKSQSQIRAICSAWSAAVVGAVAVIITSASTPVSGMNCAVVAQRADVLAYLLIIICMIGSAGVFVFWFIDQRVYQKLLHSVFAYGLFVESENKDLPQIRSALLMGNLDITMSLAWFYRVQFWVFLVIGAVFVWQPFSINLGRVPEGAKLLTYFHLGAVVLGETFRRRWTSLNTVIERIYPDLARNLPNFNKWCEESSIPDLRRKRNWLKRVASSPIPRDASAGSMAREAIPFATAVRWVRLTKRGARRVETTTSF